MKTYNFDDISWSRIKVLLQILNTVHAYGIDSVKKRYLDEESKFDSILNFLENIGILKVLNKTIQISNKSKPILMVDESRQKQFIVNQLILKNNKLTQQLREFFNKFEANGEYYDYSPSLKDRLQFSGLRNLLINIGVLKINRTSNVYSINKNMLRNFFTKNVPISYKRFLLERTKREELGLKAELAVLEREKLKFKGNPDIQNKITLVSKTNVQAGYDISSFEESKVGNLRSIYIEVKAVSEKDWKFFWSINEINISKMIGNDYYLYLVPITDFNKIDIKLTQKIQNPYKEVYSGEKIWKQNIESISFYKQ